tara:strand:- start:2931 stop:3665 length:735 start_codon:yes stop_codon:yes gene_type:complete
MNSKEKILVAICNYNHSQYLKESIESIQNQTYQNLDICVIDDRSDNQEEVLDIMEQFRSDPRVRLFANESNKGKWFCLNKAIETTDAIICTSHDADDVSLSQRIEGQYRVMKQTNTIHNLCGFYHCWNEEHVEKYKNMTFPKEKQIEFINAEDTSKIVLQGYQLPHINHYYTGNFETAGVSGMFYKAIWDYGTRFLPANQGLRVLLSEDSDFNFRVTATYGKTSITAEKLYCYRRNTSTNTEQM